MKPTRDEIDDHWADARCVDCDGSLDRRGLRCRACKAIRDAEEDGE